MCNEACDIYQSLFCIAHMQQKVKNLERK